MNSKNGLHGAGAGLRTGGAGNPSEQWVKGKTDTEEGNQTGAPAWTGIQSGRHSSLMVTLCVPLDDVLPAGRGLRRGPSTESWAAYSFRGPEASGLFRASGPLSRVGRLAGILLTPKVTPTSLEAVPPGIGRRPLGRRRTRLCERRRGCAYRCFGPAGQLRPAGITERWRHADAGLGNSLHAGSALRQEAGSGGRSNSAAKRGGSSAAARDLPRGTPASVTRAPRGLEWRGPLLTFLKERIHNQERAGRRFLLLGNQVWAEELPECSEFIATTTSISLSRGEARGFHG
eukprot:bmy_18341T0